MKTITTAIAAVAVSVTTPALAAWQTSEISTTIDGRAGVQAILEGEAVAGDIKFPARLVVRCLNKSTDVYVKPARRLASLPSALWSHFAYHTDTPVRYKVDAGPIVRGNWNSSLDNEAFGLWRGSGIALTKQLSAADKGQPLKLTIEARGMRGDGSFVFDVTGIKDAIAPIAKECGW